MNAKREKDNSAQLSFEPYIITIKGHETLKTFEQALQKVFEIHEVTEHSGAIEEVNEKFLVQLAHGIQGVEQYDAQHTPEEIVKYVKNIAKLNPSRKEACQFFLNHFKKISQYHSPNAFNSSASNNLEKISPGYNKDLLPFGFLTTTENNTKKIKKHRLIPAMCHDLKLLHLINLMRLYSDYIELGKHFPKDTNISATFNQLFKLVSTDIASSKSDQKILRKKIKLYLAVANGLLQDKSIIDLEGAEIINIALQLHVNLLKDNESLKQNVSKLAENLDFNGNFAVLRKKIQTNNCIPFFPLINKDLTFINENTFWNKIFFFGKQYHALSQTILTLREEAKKQGIFKPIFQTNLCTILDGCSLFWAGSSDKITDPDILPTLTCKTYILTKDKLIYWDKINKVHKEHNIEQHKFLLLTLKLTAQSQSFNSARLLSPSELEFISSCTTSLPKEQPIELKVSRQPSSSSKEIKKIMRHSIAITPVSLPPQSDGTTPEHFTPVIPPNHFESSSPKRISRTMRSSNYARKTVPLKTIEEKQEISGIDLKPHKELADTALLKHGYFSSSSSKRKKHHSEPVPKTDYENLTEQSKICEEEKKLTCS